MSAINNDSGCLGGTIIAVSENTNDRAERWANVTISAVSIITNDRDRKVG